MGKISRRANSEKLTRKEKQELRKENVKLQEQIKTIVLPTFAVIFFLIAAYVFVKTRTPSLPSGDM